MDINNNGAPKKLELDKNMTNEQIIYTTLNSKEFKDYMQNHYQIVSHIITKPRINSVKQISVSLYIIVHYKHIKY